jgi:hypothetical protein
MTKRQTLFLFVDIQRYMLEYLAWYRMQMDNPSTRICIRSLSSHHWLYYQGQSTYLELGRVVPIGLLVSVSVQVPFLR